MLLEAFTSFSISSLEHGPPVGLAGLLRMMSRVAA